MKKYPFSFRLTDRAQQLIDSLAYHLGVSKTAVIELAVRELARQEGLYHANDKGTQNTTKPNS